MRVRFVAPVLLSLLIAQHSLVWFLQIGVSGYFYDKYHKYSLELLLPYMTWIDWRFIAIASLSFSFVLLSQRTRPRLRAFCQWQGQTISLVTTLVGLMALILHLARWTLRHHYNFSNSEVAAELLLSFGFRLLSLLVVWQAFKASRTAIDFSNDASASLKPSVRMTIVLAAGIHLLLPVRQYLVSLAKVIFPGSIPYWLWPGQLTMLGFLIDVTIALVIARNLLIRGQRDGLFTLPKESRAATIGFCFAIAFLVLAPIIIIGSAIPYGVSRLPKEAGSLLAVTEGFGIFLLYRGLIRGEL